MSISELAQALTNFREPIDFEDSVEVKGIFLDSMEKLAVFLTTSQDPVLPVSWTLYNCLIKAIKSKKEKEIEIEDLKKAMEIMEAAWQQRLTGRVLSDKRLTVATGGLPNVVSSPNTSATTPSETSTRLKDDQEEKEVLFKEPEKREEKITVIMGGDEKPAIFAQPYVRTRSHKPSISSTPPIQTSVREDSTRLTYTNPVYPTPPRIEPSRIEPSRIEPSRIEPPRSRPPLSLPRLQACTAASQPTYQTFQPTGPPVESRYYPWTYNQSGSLPRASSQQKGYNVRPTQGGAIYRR